MFRVRLNPAVSIIRTNSRILVRSDIATLQVRGPEGRGLFNALVPLLNGTLDRRGVTRALTAYPRPHVLALLDRLERHHVIETSERKGDDRWRGQMEFFRAWAGRPEDAAERLRRARVLMVGLEPWGVTAAVELAASGVGALHLLDNGRVAPGDTLSVRVWDRRHLTRPRREALADALTGSFPWCRVTSAPLAFTEAGEIDLNKDKWDLAIAAAGRDDLRLFQSVARFAHVRNIPSLSGCLDGLDAIIGPAVIPRRTACWNCARLRQLANGEQAEVTHDLHGALLARGTKRRLRTYLAPMGSLAGHLLALEAVKLISAYTPSQLAGRILVQDLVTLTTAFHTVIRMPWCAVCGGSEDGGASPDGARRAYRRAKPRATTTRSLRAVTNPGQVRWALDGLVDARTGIIKRLVPAEPEPYKPELPITYEAVRSAYTDGSAAPAEAQGGVGAGLSAADAMIRAAGEAIERYAAARRPSSGLRYAALHHLREDALDPRCLCLYTEQQYARRGFPYVRFDPGGPIAWTRGRWIDTGRPVWVPALAVYWNVPVPPAEDFCEVTTSGLAAGADLHDASLRALMELVERDAFMITWRARLPGRRLMPDDTLRPETREIVRQVAEHGVDVELYLLDAGLGIPVVACIGLGDGARWPAVTVGLGAHPSPRVAAGKAICEMAMIGPYIARLRRDERRRIPRTPGEVRTTTEHGLYYAPAHRQGAIAFLRSGQAPPLSLGAIADPRRSAIEAYLPRLNAAGVRVAVVDVTSSDLTAGPFRVIRAVGTNLQPIDFGFDFQRAPAPRLAALLRRGANDHPHPLT